MTFFKAVIIFALIYITSASFSEQLGVHGDSLNGSVLDYPIMVPQHVLNKLTDITDFSKGLLGMWRKSRALTNKNLLKPEVSSILHAGSQCTVYADGSITPEILFLLYSTKT